MKTLLDIVRRSRAAPAPEKIPWHDPDFSERMLREHLSQAHDMASRRSEIIEAQVAWIDGMLDGASRVLDLGCGPGLYTQRLAKLGHRCTGIDFSPASIRYAIEQAEAGALAIDYRQEDVRAADYGGPYEMLMILFGEFNVFPEDDARRIARKAKAALAPGGTFLVEHQAFESVRDEGQQGPRWYSTQSGVFSDAPHIVLEEHAWDEGAKTRRADYFVVDAESAAVTHFGETMRAYDDEELAALLRDCGFTDVRRDDSFPLHRDDALRATVARVPV